MDELDALGLALAAPDQSVLQAYAELQRAYVRKRRAWCRRIGWPYAGYEGDPLPAVMDGQDPELG